MLIILLQSILVRNISNHIKNVEGDKQNVIVFNNDPVKSAPTSSKNKEKIKRRSMVAVKVRDPSESGGRPGNSPEKPSKIQFVELGTAMRMNAPISNNGK